MGPVGYAGNGICPPKQDDIKRAPMNFFFIVSIFTLALNLAACADKDLNPDAPPTQGDKLEDPIPVEWESLAFVMTKPYFADGVSASDVTSGTLVGSLDVGWPINSEDVFIEVEFFAIDKPLEEITSPADYKVMPELSIDNTRLKYMGISGRGREYGNSKLSMIAMGHDRIVNEGESSRYIVDTIMLYSSYSTILTAAEFEAYYFVPD